MTTRTALATALTVPQKDHPPRPAPVPRPHPAYIILVHGVNDVGEAYPHQEKGLCEGLKDRMDRGDFNPANYFVPSREKLKSDPSLKDYLDRPESYLFRRTPDDRTHSPVIPFYWGFREKQGRINAKEAHAQWLDRHGNRLDKDGGKNGGPFANATSTLPDMYGNGFNAKVAGFISLNWVAGEPTHPLKPAGNRRYMVLAAKRLAMLISSIRKRQPDAVIDLVAHSQGCLVSLLAHAFLAQKEGEKPVDCLIMNNPPFSLEEPFVEHASQVGDAQQSTHARVTTLRNIVEWITRTPATRPAFQTLLNPQQNQLLTGQRPGTLTHPLTREEVTFQDRDNRGHMFLYFCPDDLTVGLSSVQGIGWQGVPETKTYVAGTELETHPVLSTLGQRFHQRVWTKRVRKGGPVLVGDPGMAAYTLREKGEKYWGWAMDHTLRAEPSEGETRPLKAPHLPVPWQPDLNFGENKQGFLEVSVIDASVAITNDGRDETRDLGSGKLKTLTREEVIHDPRTPEELGMDPYGVVDSGIITKHLNQGKDPMDQIKVLSAHLMGVDRLRITYEESFREAQKRWALEESDLNSYHSAIVGNPDHSRHVTAYDLALGFLHASKKEEHTQWAQENDAFLNYLRTIADWRKKTGAFTSAMQQTENKPFYNQETPEHKQLLEATARYYTKGDLPTGIELEDKESDVVDPRHDEVKHKEWAIPPLVFQETVGQVAARIVKNRFEYS